MSDFELIPDDETIKKMAMEYGRVKARKTALGENNIVEKVSADVLENDSVKAVGSSAGAADKVFKMYCREMDLITALKCLLGKSVNKMTCDYILKLLSMKECNAAEILRIYSCLCGDGISYAPRLYCNGNFCHVLKDISRLQAELVCDTEAALKCIPHELKEKLWEIHVSECACSNIIHYLSMYCRY